MGQKPHQNQTPEEAASIANKLEDESLTSSRAAQAIPLTVGEAKTTLRFITPIYNQRVVKVDSPSTKRK